MCNLQSINSILLYVRVAANFRSISEIITASRDDGVENVISLAWRSSSNPPGTIVLRDVKYTCNFRESFSCFSVSKRYRRGISHVINHIAIDATSLAFPAKAFFPQTRGTTLSIPARNCDRLYHGSIPSFLIRARTMERSIAIIKRFNLPH